MAELQPAVLFRYENWIHAVSQAESANEARIDVNVAFNGYRYWTLIFSQRASKGTGARYQDGFVIGMSGGNNDTQNWIGEVEDLDVKMIRRGSNNFTSASSYVRDVTQYIGHIYYNWYHGYEDLVTYKFVCDTQTKTVRCYMNQVYMGYGPLNFPTTEYSNGRLEVLKTWAQLGDSNCISYLGDVWLWGCQTLEDAEDYNGGYNPGHKSHGKFLVHHSTHPSGRKMVSDPSHRMYGWKIGDPYEPPVPPDPVDPPTTTMTTLSSLDGSYSGTTTQTLTGMPSTVSDRYVMYFWIGNLTQVGDYYLYNSSKGMTDAYLWRMRSGLAKTSGAGSATNRQGFVALTKSGGAMATPVVGWVDDPDTASSLAVCNRDGWTYKSYTGWTTASQSGWSFNSLQFKIIIDQQEGVAHVYIGSVHMGYAILELDGLFDTFKMLYEYDPNQKQPRANHILVASCGVMSVLVDYNPIHPNS